MDNMVAFFWAIFPTWRHLGRSSVETDKRRRFETHHKSQPCCKLQLNPYLEAGGRKLEYLGPGLLQLPSSNRRHARRPPPADCGGCTPASLYRVPGGRWTRLERDRARTERGFHSIPASDACAARFGATRWYLQHASAATRCRFRLITAHASTS